MTSPSVVYVIATSVEGTRAALAAGIPLARGSGASIVVLVPQVVPYPVPLDRPVDSPALVVEQYRDLLRDLGSRAEIRVCLCRDADDVLRQALPAKGTVVVGGSAGRWRSSHEERLARRLAHLGYRIVFAPIVEISADAGTRQAAAASTVEWRLPLYLVPFTALLLLGAPTSARAQDPDGQPPAAPVAQCPAAELSLLTWQYGGFVDVGYLRDFNHPSIHLFRSRGTAFQLNEWDVNMAGAYVKKKASEQSRWGTELLVQGGKDEEVFGFSATAPNLAGADWIGHLGLANVSYLAPAGAGLTLQGGIFASFIGYDSLYAKDNFNYTRPWGADFTPYLMTGVNASYAVTDKAAAAVFVANGYWHLANANSVPSSGGQFAYKASPRVTIKETVLLGPHQANTSLKFWRFLSDSIFEHRGDRVIAAFEYQISTERVDASGHPRAWWMSAQLPMHWTVREPWSISVRPEVAWDSTGRWTAYEQSITAITTTFEYRMPYRWADTILRLEHRFDDSRGEAGGFFNDGEVSPGVAGLKPTQHLLIFGLIFTFDSPSQR
jgi:hypothetical protein